MIEEDLLPRDTLYNWRKKAWDRFKEIGMPKRKQEAFQYTQIDSLIWPSCAQENEATQVPSESRYICRFVDGFFDAKNSVLPQEIVCLPLDVAMRSYGVFLQNRSTKTLKEEIDPFAALNGALLGRGIFLYVPPQFELTEFLEIQHQFTSEEMITPRIQIFLGRSSRLKLVQTIHFSKTSFFSNALLDLSLDEKSHCELIDAQFLSSESRSFQSIRATLKKESHFSSLSLTQGGALARTSYKVQLLEEGSETLLQGLASLDKTRQNHIHATVEHIAPSCKSRQNFKTILKGESKGSFEGKIIVRQEAQKTEAYQRSSNLPLSSEAEIYAKPNLEIFADDVKASHGATIAQIEEEELFYLRSRGLSLEQAKEWLVQGFCQDLLNAIPDGALFDTMKQRFTHA